MRGEATPALRDGWAREAADVLAELRTDRHGLPPEEAAERLRRYGPNALAEARPKSAWTILLDQLRSVIMALLAAAAAVSFVFGETVDAAAIIAVLAINVAIGFFSELRATRSMEALRRLGSVKARVRRGGTLREVHARDLVPGDIVVLEGGDAVSADLRILEASRLQADESTLTGESAPVDKGTAALPPDAPLVDRTNMLFRGTSVVRGSGEGVAVATGMATELGRIARMVEEAEEETTPLEKRLEALGRKLVYAMLVIAVVTTTVGILAGREAFLMVEMGIALAVAAIPEGLSIVATIALARGMWRLARRNALVNRLSAVETLGATNVILTDKTGTLTENRMTLARVALPLRDVDLPAPPEPPLIDALEIGALCNNAALPSLGDPLEVALLEGAAAYGVRRLPRVREEAFDATLRIMATVHRDGDRFLYAVKGAPEPVVRACGSPPGWLERNERLAREGMRVLAVARKWGGTGDQPPYEGLEMVGLVGLLDPPRADARDAVEACRRAGISVVMVTGDHAATAGTIARAVGIEERRVVVGRDLGALTRRELLDVRVFARVAPEQKLDLVRAHQEEGAVVAMTGDGVNDAPALKKADIGIAMGLRGTDVAREAADVVLKDDAFSSIVAAIRQGRIIFGNVRRFVFYLLSCNASEILLVAGATVAEASLPILPLQILFLNLVTDVFPALALALGEGEGAVMERPPRDPREPVLARRHWIGIAAYGGVMTACALGAHACAVLGLGYADDRAITVAFLTLAFAQVVHVFNMRDRGTPFLRNEVTRSPWVWGAVALCAALLLAAVYVDPVSRVLRLPPPDGRGWLVILLAAGLTWVAGQSAVTFRPRSGRSSFS
ncbi:MAG: cation-transporting P-type ATPase [Planctomycetes bacterium]|nr:cation-transporting P-type ATPase [Planctomycetota bacterium]